MRRTNEAVDFQRYMADRDIDARIKSSQDDMLRIMQSDIKVLDSKIGRLDDKISNVLSMLRWGIGMFVTILLALAALAVPVAISLLG